MWHGYGTLQNENEFLLSLYLAILVEDLNTKGNVFFTGCHWHYQYEWVTEWIGEYEKYVNPRPS